MRINVGKYTLSQQFHVAMEHYLNTTKNKLKVNILKGLTSRLNTWQSLVYSALSKDISSVSGEVSAKSHSATKDRSRLFPYMRSGALRNAVKVRAEVKNTTSKAKLEFSVRASINIKRAIYTNNAHSSLPSGWKGWMEDIMVGNGRGSVNQSVREIFNDFNSLRRERLF